LLHPLTAGFGRLCSLIPGLGVKLSTIILAGPTVLSAVGACPPHDGVRRRWWINVASASPFRTLAKNRTISPSPPSRQGRLFPPCRGNRVISLCVLRGSLFRRPVELGSVDPHAVQNDRELPCDGDLGLVELRRRAPESSVSVVGSLSAAPIHRRRGS
jgi:hypothetical protein